MARKVTLGNLTLSWHERNGQWRKSIGFKPDKRGRERIPAEWYFGADEAAAMLAAQAKIEEWERVVANWSTTIGIARTMHPHMPKDRPFWLITNREKYTADKQAIRTVREREPKNVTVEKAKERYVASLRLRLTMMGAKGLKQSTFNTILASLECALAATGPDGAPALPPTALIHLITHADISSVVDFHYQKGGVSERSALNYCRAFQAFLAWMDNQPDLRFQKPKGMDGLFKLGTPAANPKVPTVAEVRKLYRACRDDAERLWVLLGVNCGMYEADISNLTPAALITHKREPHCWWRREKTSHQNAFYTLHWLFPETVRLIEAVRAPANPHGRLLLDRQGNPLSESKEGFRTKAISGVFPGLVKRAGLTGKGISFKSLRKFGAHELRLHAKGDKDDTARKYLGQAIPGVLKSYVLDDFGDLTSELKRFHARLLTAKVLESAPAAQGPHQSE